jgi:DNA repair ATPase RecN
MEQFSTWFVDNANAIQIIAAVLSLVAGLIPISGISQNLIWRILGREEPPKVESYSERLSRLTHELTKASVEVDSLLTELAKVASDREHAVQRLESNLTKLEEHEKNLQKRIDDLKSVPVPVAEHFASLIAQGEKRSAWRDYILFGIGVVVSTVIAIVLRLAGLG